MIKKIIVIYKDEFEAELQAYDENGNEIINLSDHENLKQGGYVMQLAEKAFIDKFFNK